MMKLEDYDAVAALARGTWYLTKQVLRKFMLKQKGGRIIMISSVVGHIGNRGQTPYTMAKAGLDAFTRSLALELGGRDILVNSVAPGFIETDMTAELPRGDAKARSSRASRSAHGHARRGGRGGRVAGDARELRERLACCTSTAGSSADDGWRAV